MENSSRPPPNQNFSIGSFVKTDMKTSYSEIEERILAPYATKSAESKGRVYPEVEHPYRSPFQRDRDRIIHTSAFRRLEGKTQVFVTFTGDYYRNRLTHTIEVAQISRTIARALRLNEDVAEAIALAHDLGHSPFGHVGESVLNELMRRCGGFEHNEQSLRVVDLLETRYPDFPGLNLSWEIREGIIKHSTAYDHPGKNMLDDENGGAPTLEAQIVNIADEITYSCHDVDDGQKAGILDEKTLRSVGLPARVFDSMKRSEFENSEKMRRYHLVRGLINIQVTDLLVNTSEALERRNIRNLDDVRAASGEIVGFSAEMASLNHELKSHLHENFYRHPRVVKMTDVARRIIASLFEVYLDNMKLLPADLADRFRDEDPERIVCDYIAGMTDMYAKNEYEKIIGKVM